MSAVHDEGRLRFSFDDGWKVLKWDDHLAFSAGLQKMTGTRAVDFLGLQLDVPWFIEVKDFRGYRVENKRRLTSGELAGEVADKVRDTLAGLAWACNRDPLDQGELASFLRRIVCRDGKIPVVLWLEEDQPPSPAEVSALTEAIKRRLDWLNARVIVLSRATAARRPVDGLTVDSLPRQPS